ncbi:hypothetical protein [uncultured Paracoccus sp.]|uniref:hypothetical protein n=1 Tax=uncultured Paracoccus sp. TaxID=189685 RepID=UPI0025F204F7|nr:hypothetical protein [uncultured Paracoccus sp.]
MTGPEQRDPSGGFAQAKPHRSWQALPDEQSLLRKPFCRVALNWLGLAALLCW